MVLPLRGAFADCGLPVPRLLATARESFYRTLGSGPRQLSFAGEYAPIEPVPGQLDLALVRQRVGALASNDDASVLDVGDGVVLLEFHGKMNTLGAGALDMLARALELVSRGGFAGLVIHAGANVVRRALEPGRKSPRFSSSQSIGVAAYKNG